MTRAERDAFVMQHCALVRKLAITREHRSRERFHWDDLAQAAFERLLRCASTYDPA